MKLSDKISTERLVEAKTLPADTYFAIVQYHNGLEVSIGTSFLFDGKRYTRLWDASYVDSFFKGSGGDQKVFPIEHKDAVALAIEYRRG